MTGILASGPLADRVDNRLLLFGLVDVSTVAPTQWLAARYVQPQTVGLAFGCLNATHQLGSALGAWLPGVAYDASGSYDSVLAVSAGVLVVAALTCLTLPRPRPLAPQPA